VQYPYEDKDLLVILAHDTDAFNRWEAAQRLYMNVLLTALSSPTPLESTLPPDMVMGLRSVLRDSQLDAAFKDLVLTLPSETYIAEQCEMVDPQKIHSIRQHLRTQLAHALHGRLGMGLSDARTPRHVSH
jgi:aminopeptidase N